VAKLFFSIISNSVLSCCLIGILIIADEYELYVNNRLRFYEDLSGNWYVL